MAERFGPGPDTTFTKLLAPKGHGRSSRVTFYYGIGGWDDTSVAEFTHHTAWLELASRTDTLRLMDREPIRRLLLDRRQGIAKSCVMLEIR